MHTESTTRYSGTLSELRFSFNLLYVGRLLVGMAADERTAQSMQCQEDLEEVDEQLEAVTDELIATELLHEAALLAGDVLTRES